MDVRNEKTFMAPQRQQLLYGTLLVCLPYGIAILGLLIRAASLRFTTGRWPMGWDAVVPRSIRSVDPFSFPNPGSIILLMASVGAAWFGLKMVAAAGRPMALTVPDRCHRLAISVLGWLLIVSIVIGFLLRLFFMWALHVVTW